MKKYLFVVLIVLILIVAIFLYIFLRKGDNNLTGGIGKNDPEIEKLVTISQSEMSSFVFVTQESENDHRLNINLTPFLNFDLQEKELKEFKINNFKGEGEVGEILLITPTDLGIDTASRTFLFTVAETIKQDDIKSSADSIEYSVASEVKKYNEVSNQGNIIPHFGVIIKNIGTVDYKEILERDGTFDGLKYLEYSGVNLNSLDTTIQFDIYMKFTDNSKYTKRLKATISGEKIGSEISPMFNLEVVE